METAIINVRDGRRMTLVPGSLVNFFETDYRDFSTMSIQGIVEEIISEEEITIRTIGGKTFKQIKLRNIYI